METINNMASAAAKAVWGESKSEEPVSGHAGDTGKGEPYDAGNLDETSNRTDATGDHATSTGTTTTGSESTPVHKADPAGVHSKTTGTAKEPESAPNNPSTNLKSHDAPTDTSKGQNDIRDPENPQTHPKGAPTDVDNTGDGPNEAQKLDGPGPKPLDQVAKQHGGDAGTRETSDDKDSAASAGGASAGAPGADANDELHQKSKSEGTGEQYVKSTGLKADGGDFDATKPGAGREADRLLEEKGIHTTKNEPKSESAGSTEQPSEDKEKVSLKDKIKAKLHKH